MKIGLLIPTTSNKRNWKDVKESYLFLYTIKSFFSTYDKENDYVFYIGVDRGDKIFDNKESQEYLINFFGLFKNISIDFTYMDNIVKGHLTVMWTRLFKKAYNDNCDYFFQCGDDIIFATKGWTNACINKLKENNDIGVSGPVTNNPRILTQSMISRKHMEIFGYYFPEEIINWFCDDWINEVYKSINKLFFIKDHYCNNAGGKPRYQINNSRPGQWADTSDRMMREICTNIVKRDVEKIYNYLESS